MTRRWRVVIVGVGGMLVVAAPWVMAKPTTKPPVEDAQLTYAPAVPPPITRKTPAIVRVRLDSSIQTAELSTGMTYQFWTFNGHVPGPFIRTRVGDTLVDHAIFRVEKGAVGFLNVEGEPRHDLYVSQDDATACPGCLVHP